jgi:hypothetical protein
LAPFAAHRGWIRDFQLHRAQFQVELYEPVIRNSGGHLSVDKSGYGSGVDLFMTCEELPVKKTTTELARRRYLLRLWMCYGRNLPG